MKNTIKYTIPVSTMLLIVGLQSLFAATSTTYAVGSCKPLLRSFVHIQDALNATPPPTVVEVCPATYNEQVTITQGVTLEGVSNGDSDQAVIAPPTGGLTANAVDDFGDSLGVQLWVDNASGLVNISNLTVDGTGNGVTTFCAPFIVGVFYQNSSGIVNHLTSRNQKGNQCGDAVLIEGGTSNPSVTIENSSIHDFDNVGIEAETNSVPSQLTATIKGNVVTNPNTSFNLGILAGGGATSTVTGNFVAGVSVGIDAGGSGPVSGNTVMAANQTGIYAGADGAPVTSNRIFNTPFGISLFTSVATIQGNNITNASVGIEFKPNGCYADPNVHSNTITDASIGIDQVPTSVTSTNTYYNVGTIKTGGC